jgi:hypothetical protein
MIPLPRQKRGVLPRAKVADDFTAARLPAEQKAEKHNRPNETVRENFQGRNLRKQFPINRDQSHVAKEATPAMKADVCGGSLSPDLAISVVFHQLH